MNHSIDRVGNLIAVCGNSGSGKSTLVRHALHELPGELKYMNTITTRPRRLDEDDVEYTFVSGLEYEQYRHSASIWDETIIYGNRYGVNATLHKEALDQGQNVIFCTIPSFEVMEDMRSIYGQAVLKTVQLMAGLERSAEQAKARDGAVDLGRTASDNTTDNDDQFEADYTLVPSGSLGTDKVNFLNIIRIIIS